MLQKKISANFAKMQQEMEAAAEELPGESDNSMERRSPRSASVPHPSSGVRRSRPKAVFP